MNATEWWKSKKLSNARRSENCHQTPTEKSKLIPNSSSQISFTYSNAAAYEPYSRHALQPLAWGNSFHVPRDSVRLNVDNSPCVCVCVTSNQLVCNVWLALFEKKSSFIDLGTWVAMLVRPDRISARSIYGSVDRLNGSLIRFGFCAWLILPVRIQMHWNATACTAAMFAVFFLCSAQNQSALYKSEWICFGCVWVCLDAFNNG